MSQLQNPPNKNDILNYDWRLKYMQGLKHFTDTKVPIYRGCPNKGSGGCFCPGTCREIIGYRDKIAGEF